MVQYEKMQYDTVCYYLIQYYSIKKITILYGMIWYDTVLVKIQYNIRFYIILLFKVVACGSTQWSGVPE